MHPWDQSLRTAGWADQVKNVLSYGNIEVDHDHGEMVDLDALKARLEKLNKQKWLVEAADKPKLQTLV